VSFSATHAEQQDGDWKQYERWWKSPDCRIVHFIGEDNTVFHALIWPAMLMAEGSYELPRHVVANKFLNIKFPGQEEQKISKSRGNAIWIENYLETFDPDPLRYYLTAIAPESARSSFDVDDFIARNNGELLNALGNFINRALTFTQRYFDGVVPEIGERTDVDREQMERIARQADLTAEHLEGFRFRAALGEVMALARASNGYFDAKRPWQQRRENMAACATTLNVCIQTVRALTVLMAPFLPHSAEKCAEMLRIPGGSQRWEDAKQELAPGHALGDPVILFRKLEAGDLVRTPDGP
jgi:methionyl-tRNA synthetase